MSLFTVKKVTVVEDKNPELLEKIKKLEERNKELDERNDELLEENGVYRDIVMKLVQDNGLWDLLKKLEDNECEWGLTPKKVEVSE